MFVGNRRHFIKGAVCSIAAASHGALSYPQNATSALHALGVIEAAEGLRRREITSVALVQACLARIAHSNPQLNAWITVAGTEALREAVLLDREAAGGHFRGPLHGVPLAIKDNIDTAGLRTTMGSLVFDDRVPEQDAFVVSQLRRAGAVVLGKTNLHEFAMGGSSATSYFGPVHNPWAPDRVPGGSSGGSAAAVIAEMAPGALGTDTGGSIRIPAAWCGLVGLKPTYGLVSLRGIFPLIYSLDHCGPMARSVADTAMMLKCMAGYDKQDPASVEHPVEDYVAGMQQPVSGFRVGVPRTPFFDHLDAGTAAIIETALGVLRGLVKSVEPVHLPSTDAMRWTSIRAAEVAAVHREIFAHQGGEYSLQTHRVVEGTLAGLNDASATAAERAADLVQARWELEHLRRNIDDAFDGFDLVALPTNRIQPRTIREQLDLEEKPTATEPQSEFNSLPFNLYGIPAISVPCGFTAQGLPVGLMIAGPHFSESRVLALAAAFERSTKWQWRRPTL